VTLVRTDASDERIASIIRVERIKELGTTLRTMFLRSVLQLLVNANVDPGTLILALLMWETIHSSETSVVTRIKLHHIREDGIL
jgi:hypothetical protein